MGGIILTPRRRCRRSCGRVPTSAEVLRPRNAYVKLRPPDAEAWATRPRFAPVNRQDTPKELTHGQAGTPGRDRARAHLRHRQAGYRVRASEHRRHRQGQLRGRVARRDGRSASPVLIEKVRSMITDGTGQYQIIDLRPGTYAVTFTLPGFSTAKREGIELIGSFAATVNVELRV